MIIMHVPEHRARRGQRCNTAARSWDAQQDCVAFSGCSDDGLLDVLLVRKQAGLVGHARAHDV